MNDELRRAGCPCGGEVSDCYLEQAGVTPEPSRSPGRQ